MPGRVKGLTRRAKHGQKGPKTETLIKKLSKKRGSEIRKALKKTKKPNMSFEGFKQVLTRRYRTDTTIGMTKALDTLYLDPKNPADKKTRAEIQKLGQAMANLEIEINLEQAGKERPRTRKELEKTKREITKKIIESKGTEAMKKFNEAYKNTMGKIQKAHDELAEKRRKNIAKNRVRQK